MWTECRCGGDCDPWLEVVVAVATSRPRPRSRAKVMLCVVTNNTFATDVGVKEGLVRVSLSLSLISDSSLSTDTKLRYLGILPPPPPPPPPPREKMLVKKFRGRQSHILIQWTLVFHEIRHTRLCSPATSVVPLWESVPPVMDVLQSVGRNPRSQVVVSFKWRPAVLCLSQMQDLLRSRCAKLSFFFSFP